MDSHKKKLLSQIRVRIAIGSSLFLFIAVSIYTRKLLGWSVFGDTIEYIYLCLGFVYSMVAYQKCEEIVEEGTKKRPNSIMHWYFIIALLLFASLAVLDLIILLKQVK